MRLLLVSLSALALTNSLAVAQQTRQPKVAKEATDFATKVAAANAFEIKASQLASDHASRADVKTFAQQIVDDHTKEEQAFNAAIAAAKVPAPKEEPDAQHATMIDKLQTEKGAAFDTAYLKEQATAHRQAVALFKRYAASGATPALKDFAQKTLPTLEQHEKMAQDLAKKK